MTTTTSPARRRRRWRERILQRRRQLLQRTARSHRRPATSATATVTRSSSGSSGGDTASISMHQSSDGNDGGDAGASVAAAADSSSASSSFFFFVVVVVVVVVGCSRDSSPTRRRMTQMLPKGRRGGERSSPASPKSLPKESLVAVAAKAASPKRRQRRRWGRSWRRRTSLRDGGGRGGVGSTMLRLNARLLAPRPRAAGRGASRLELSYGVHSERALQPSRVPGCTTGALGHCINLFAFFLKIFRRTPHPCGPRRGRDKCNLRAAIKEYSRRLLRARPNSLGLLVDTQPSPPLSFPGLCLLPPPRREGASVDTAAPFADCVSVVESFVALSKKVSSSHPARRAMS